MRDGGLEQAIDKAGGVRALARELGLSQPAVTNWKRVPAERVLEVEAATGVSRSALRPDLYPDEKTAARELDEVDAARAATYAMLGALLWRAPAADLLATVGRLPGDASELGITRLGLADAARAVEAGDVEREFFDLFIGVGRGELLPYASFYLSGFLHERPLARVREDFLALGIEREDRVAEPEDHVAVLFDVMAGLIRGDFSAEGLDDEIFFTRQLKPWVARFFADLETASAARFYRAVGAYGRLFVEIEAEAFALPA
jgi:TorA maturation chaperone TorD